MKCFQHCNLTLSSTSTDLKDILVADTSSPELNEVVNEQGDSKEVETIGQTKEDITPTCPSRSFDTAPDSTADPVVDPTGDTTADPAVDTTVDPTVDTNDDTTVDTTADTTVNTTVEPSSSDEYSMSRCFAQSLRTLVEGGVQCRLSEEISHISDDPMLVVGRCLPHIMPHVLLNKREVSFFHVCEIG